jgi:putative hydroxymethylpyrimidine transport system permease protein
MLKQYGPPTAVFVAHIAAWELACRTLGVPAYIVPAPSRVAVALWQWRVPLFTQHLPVTLKEALAGLLISIVLGIALAVVMHASPLVDRALYPLIVASQTIPTIAISPVFLFWFGYSVAQKVAVVVLISFFSVAVATRDGLRAADPDLLAWMQAAGASRWKRLTMAEIPAALPAFFSGLKIAASVSVIGAVLGEWLGGSEGLGVFGRRAANNLKSADLFASVTLLALLGVLLFLLAALLERLALRHRR